MAWPFQEWGASVVLAGHDHIYERIELNGFPYLINGLGGYPARYALGNDAPGSQVAYNGDYGALRVEATADSLFFEFYRWDGARIDDYRLESP
jgi:hypothetical protein